ncbi:hypothetical protein MUY35_05005 [Aliiroseovarius sp. S1339]|uniref:hypothetical protein n=1 Tax=Aliiroseovarius sp. S1339 TaxID=2936990 RepID=UPI0020BFDF07|nr:hypothetical protein [Aliiroseovarius sp. S1339]MCK8463204.1 hypothetical protein [Aliiroseovarius sp. S1339]
MTKRSTFDDIRAERDQFIGPPEPYHVPKFTPPADKAKLRKILDLRLAETIARETAANRKPAADLSVVRVFGTKGGVI